MEKVNFRKVVEVVFEGQPLDAQAAFKSVFILKESITALMSAIEDDTLKHAGEIILRRVYEALTKNPNLSCHEAMHIATDISLAHLVNCVAAQAAGASPPQEPTAKPDEWPDVIGDQTN